MKTFIHPSALVVLMTSAFWLSASSVQAQTIRMHLAIKGENSTTRLAATEKGFQIPTSAIGKEYSLVIRNNHYRKVAVVVAIDGVLILGKRVNRKGMKGLASSPGYLLNPFSTATIRGWRTSSQKVQAFKFTPPEQSVAIKLGESRKVGRIELVAMEEKIKPRPVFGVPKGPFGTGGMGSRLAIRKVGTGEGQSINDRVRNVKFERGRIVSRMQIPYELITLRTASND